MVNWEETIRENLSWFKNSGVLVDEGKMGVHERVWLLSREHPLVNGNRLLEDNIFRYRRVDCALETAVMFALAEGIFPSEDFGSITRKLLKFVNDNPFQERRLEHPEFGLYAHGLTFDYALSANVDRRMVRSYRDGTSFWDKKWVDDNSWAVILSLYLWGTGMYRGLDSDVEKALLTAHALLDKKEILKIYSRGQLDGVPHWGGMRSMALAYTYAFTNDERFKCEAINSLQKDFEKINDFRKGKTKQPYDLSNCTYFVMQGSAIRKAINDKDLEEALDVVVNYLIARQSEVGHWPGEWWEGSSGEDVADLVYGQNWATLGLQAYTQLTGDKKSEAAYRKSLEFLASIQNKSNFAKTNGVWCGAYDVKRKNWGGEDREEGGPSCIYTGWTNAPINIAFMVCHEDIWTPILPKPRGFISPTIYEAAKKEYEAHKAKLISAA